MNRCGDCRYGNVLSLYHPDKISCGLHEGAKIYHKDESCELYKHRNWPKSPEVQRLLGYPECCIQRPDDENES